jgi:hypothetical protein
MTDLELLCERLRKAQFDALLDLAQRARDDGWEHPLLRFVATEGRLPTADEMRGIMMVANLYGAPPAGRA